MSKANSQSTKQNNNPSNKRKKKHNYILWTGFVVVMIPVCILLYIIFRTMGNTDEPVNGDRFENDLNPAISEKKLKELKGSLVFDGVEGVNVNLKTATLRININTNDDLNGDQITAIMNQAYDKVIAVLPIETYFTNKKNCQMYDVEVNVYNLIPDDKTTIAPIYVVKSKSAAASEATIDVKTTPLDEKLANTLMTPPEVPATK
ncbi:MAG: hypothetical protein RR538_02205 [Erysipelotrichaceae bacterium]